MTQDNRIQFPPAEIDFVNNVGLSGQDHDDYPAENQQPRYDWWRMVVIGLLSNQSSVNLPTQYRPGTIWFNTIDLRIWDSTKWAAIAERILLGETITLADWYVEATEKFNRIQPRFTFSGKCITNNIQKIPIPDSIQTGLTGIVDLMKPLLYINGLLIDPRQYKLSSGCPIYVELLNTLKLTTNDTFTVIIERFDISITEEVLA